MSGTTANIEKLVTNNQRMVHYICRRYFRVNLQCFDYDDLVQVGNIGLIYAARRYRPEIGKFSTIAYRLIYTTIQKYFRDNSAGGIRIPRRQKQAGVTVPCLSYQAEVTNKDSNVPLTFESVIGEGQDFTRPYVDEFWQMLNSREQEILRLRMAGLTQQEIAKIFNISQAQISRIISKIRKKFMKYENANTVHER